MKGYPRKEPELPDTASVADELLHFLWLRKRPLRPLELYDLLADTMHLDHLQRHARRRTREERAWNNRVQTAREHLVRLGFLDPSRRGFWSLTTAGREEAERRAKFRASGDPADLGL